MAKTKYNIIEHLRFVCDMEAAGLKVELYHGRYFWHGPSVDVDNLQDALSGTKIPCQWDNMGKGYVVYPKANDPSLEKVHEDFDDEKDEE
jgi:hypothetical protein